LDTPPLARQGNNGVNESPPVFETGFADVLPEPENVPVPGVKLLSRMRICLSLLLLLPGVVSFKICVVNLRPLKGGGGTLKLCVVKFGLLKRGVGTLICGREMLMCGMLTCGRGMLICGMLTGPALAAPTDANANVPTMAK
jgi:hypothetical protein